MSEAPERIWAITEPDDISADILGEVYAQQIPDGMNGTPVEYVRADRIEALEVKLAKAIGDLGRLSRAEVFGDGGAWGMRLSEDALGREILARMKFARTTLAELTGGKDE